MRDGVGEWDENGKVDNYILSMNCQHGISDAMKAEKAVNNPELVSQFVCLLHYNILKCGQSGRTVHRSPLDRERNVLLPKTAGE